MNDFPQLIQYDHSSILTCTHLKVVSELWMNNDNPSLIWPTISEIPIYIFFCIEIEFFAKKFALRCRWWERTEIPLFHFIYKIYYFLPIIIFLLIRYKTCWIAGKLPEASTWAQTIKLYVKICFQISEPNLFITKVEILLHISDLDQARWYTPSKL